MTAGSAAAAIAAACADACAGTAAAVATVAARAAEDGLIIGTLCVTAIAAVAAVGSLAARGIHRAATDEVERVALGQFDAGTATRQSAGIGACAGDGLALRHVEIHRAPDGQSAAARYSVGETEVVRGVIVRRGVSTAERLARRGASIQCRPVGLGGLRLLIHRSPFVLCPRPLHDGAEQQGKN